ncbi:arginyltransferase [Oleiagrimonas sp. C23AA]|uniref:arginyltransferase n=1 Tax=Oleiagrimonas sp. C23AA TaxID=2719047 RepID=UPI00141DCFCA|nr:arginyltransferase [Oleiagrimonas sp. C23AA]NII11690.1 arginyltransferase [Oleiagrimonas sp. C23AA]
MRSDRVRLFQTLPHSCGYYAGRTAQNLVIDPAAPNLDRLYPQALESGFRRAGGHLYHPRCEGCRACVPCRIPVDRFTPSRSQRRCLARNEDLAVVETAPGYNEERYALYTRYLHSRHRNGGMDDADPEDFQRFLTAPWSPTVFLEIRQGRELVGVAVTDVTERGPSAVYTFFEPGLGARSLGTFAILKQLELAAQMKLPHVYLGFWIESHPKMDYKRRFHPLEILVRGGWRELAPPR